MNDPLAFAQFRRLLLGVVVEILHDLRGAVDADVSGMVAAFEPESGFRFLWFDNWMRFRGSVRVPLRAAPAPQAAAALQARFDAVWPEIVGALRGLPLADKLEITRQEVHVRVGDEGPAGSSLEIAFDLEAD
jgi:hypothetical protein